MSGKTGLAFIGGLCPPADFCGALAERADVICAADSGLIAAEDAGIKPDFIAGDMDSLDDESRLLKYPQEIIFRFPEDKDFTDTEIAVKMLRERGCGSIILAGGGGGRLSHLFAVKTIFERADDVTEWYTKNEKIFLLKGALSLPVRKDNLISVFPLGAPPFRASSMNLKWPLDEVRWEGGFTGISNAPLAGEVFLRAQAGKFLIIVE